MMAASGILGEYKGSQAREVMMTREEWQHAKKQQLLDAQQGYEYTKDDDQNHSPTNVNEGQRGYLAVEDDEE
jgi:hypothetical protein